MKNLFYKLYLKYKGVPHRGHVRFQLDKKQPRNMLKRQVANLYIKGSKVDLIAINLRISRERVRQILLNVVR